MVKADATAVRIQKIPGLPKSSGPTFARHESFHPRFGWLKKGFDKSITDPAVFLRDDAVVSLGVGKNMVRAIRYWVLAFKVMEETLDAKNRLLVPTQFGSDLLSDGGWDPYLEDAASLWLLHWSLLQAPSFATTWHFVFNHFRHVDFTSEELLIALTDFISQKFPQTTVAESSLKNDVACFIRMYSSGGETTKLNEETIVCPFVELGLIEQIGNSKRYTFRVGSKHNLPSEIVAALCLHYADATRPGLKSINLSHLLYNENSPGLCFRLTESALCSSLEEIAQLNYKVALSDTAGIVQMQFSSDPLELAREILNDYFSSRGGNN